MSLLPTERDGKGNPGRQTLFLRSRCQYWVCLEAITDFSILIVKNNFEYAFFDSSTNAAITEMLQK
jgi:hypothetical protein